MVLMALDHANTLLSWGSPAEFWGGAVPAYGSPAAFLLRFASHLCAPGFFLLMGVGMTLLRNARAESGWPVRRIRHFFMARGLLIVVIHFAMSVTFAVPGMRSGSFGIIYNVLFALGTTMIVSAWLMGVPTFWLLLISAGSLLVPQFVLGDPSRFGEAIHPVWRLIAVPGPMHESIVLYTFFPWFGLTVAGLIMGRALLKDPQTVVRRIPLAALVCLVAFAGLRVLNGFGNLRPMHGAGWMAFLSLTKYPPSLTFVLLTVGANLLLLWLLYKLPPRLLRPPNPLIVFGRTALFFYVLHYSLFFVMAQMGLNGLPRPLMLPLWLLGLAVAYPLCRWYGTYRSARPVTSVWRLL